MSEADRQKRITDALERFGWLWVHYRTSVDPRRGGAFRTALDGHKGAPDLLAVHPERGLTLFIEVKSDKGRLSPEQKGWLAALSGWAFKVERLVPASEKGRIVIGVCGSGASEAELLSLISDGRLR